MEGLLYDTIRRSPQNVEQFLGFIGTGTPAKRALIVATLATAACYAAKVPVVCFTEEGEINGFHPDPERSVDPETKTQVHFLLVPLLAGAIGYLFL
mmetsp:Transcript_17344/g.43159  ORF Transcript_17344/g.43159 Transcript_17344/m.43159 type:complete len:96 (+) Transcript_17344:809-1096(+)